MQSRLMTYAPPDAVHVAEQGFDEHADLLSDLAYWVYKAGEMLIPPEEMSGIWRLACFSPNVTGFRARFAQLVLSYRNGSKSLPHVHHGHSDASESLARSLALPVSICQAGFNDSCRPVTAGAKPAQSAYSSSSNCMQLPIDTDGRGRCCSLSCLGSCLWDT